MGSKGSAKLTFFWEGQLELGTAQPLPTLPGNLARPVSPQLSPKAPLAGIGDILGSLLPFSLGIPDHTQSLSLKAGPHEQRTKH